MKQYKIVNKLSQTDAAYLAGLIDGDGTITLSRREKNSQRTIVVGIANTEIDLLKHALNTIGAGSISSKVVTKLNHTPSFSYQISGRQAVNLLGQIITFLRSHKKDRALIVIRDYIRLTPRNGKYSPEITQQRTKFISDFFDIRVNKNNMRGQVIF